jgi:hypothetical protein
MSAILKNAELIYALESQYADYLFAKYIEPADLETTELPTTPSPAKEKYINTMFIKPAKPLTLMESIKQEHNTIKRATELYTANPEHYKNCKTEYGFPDQFRCQYITKHNKYIARCALKKSADDINYCTRHKYSINAKAAEYLQLINQLTN